MERFGLLKTVEVSYKNVVERLKAKKVYPKNPLGVIALFVFLIEAISTVSLKFLLDSQSPYVGYFIAFIVFFPLIIALLFFGTLWFRRESFYSPADFRDDASFVQLFYKVERLEAKQQATQVDPRGDDTTQALPAIQRLQDVNEVEAAIRLGKAFLKVERYSISGAIFEEMEARVPASHHLHPDILAQRAYSLIGQQQFDAAIQALLKAQSELPQPHELRFWPSLGLAFSYLRIGEKEESKRWLSHAKSTSRSPANFPLQAEVYSEFEDDLKTNS